MQPLTGCPEYAKYMENLSHIKRAELAEAELVEQMHTGNYTKEGWYYNPRYQG
jgi:hypothetical protein